jgi:hypothetical protein
LRPEVEMSRMFPMMTLEEYEREHPPSEIGPPPADWPTA